TIAPSLAGPTRPQDRVALADVRASFVGAVDELRGQATAHDAHGSSDRLGDGSVVIAAITSCTNTSNPSVMIAAGLLAKKAVERGLTVKSWVKTSLAPGSRVVTEYLAKADLARHLERLGFFTVGYGCTTCIGNSGPLPPAVSQEIASRGLVVSAVLSGNRNFEGRVHPEVRANYLASPPLVVAYALAGRVDLDLTRDPIGTGIDGKPVMLAELWPTRHEVEQTVQRCLDPQMFRDVYATVFEGDEAWMALEIPEGDLYAWDDASTYVKLPPYFEGMSRAPAALVELRGARVLAWLGDSITTDHISPAGSIQANGPAGQYLRSKGVDPVDFNSYGSRRGNHEVMVRGTFANVRLRNRIAPGTEGGVTRHLPDGAPQSIFDAAMKYAQEGTPLVILAGKEYGSGSSRDWAAKGPKLLGVRAVIAESYERIHRSNLVGMGLLPLQFEPGKSAESYGLTGEETFAIEGVVALFEGAYATKQTVRVKATRADGSAIDFDALLRIDTPQEALYYRHGGILPYVLRDLLSRA
ncbi:MAG: aconitate hydratase AcnA, partial [Polyangiales bacterium]